MIETPLIKQVRRKPEHRPWIKRILSIREPVIYEIRNIPGYEYPTYIEGKSVVLFIPYGFRTDGASSPPFSWLLGFRPDGILAIGSYFHDFYYLNGFLLNADGERIFQGRGKSFADWVLAKLTKETAGINAPGSIARFTLACCGWPAWWSNKKYRDRSAANPQHIELHGGYDDFNF